MATVNGGHASNSYISPDSDGMQTENETENGDLLHGEGSASSLGSSAASSVFTHSSHAFTNNNRKTSAGNGLTPLTNHTESSPPKGNSPPHSKNTTAMASVDGILAASHTSAAHMTSQPTQQPPPRPQMLPPPGKVKGYRAVWDPELDGKLSKEERKRAIPKKREFGTETYEPDPPPDPRLAIPGYMSGQCRSRHMPSKAILRIAPYTVPPYKIDRNSIGPGEAQAVVAIGFDPFLPEPTLRLNFGTFGTIASVQNKTDPETGSFLGIALIKYRDAVRDGLEVTAVEAAKRAEVEFNGQRIGVHTVRVELDREGRRCKRYVDQALKKLRDERVKDQIAAAPPAPAEMKSAKDSPAPPPNAPKGPSSKSAPKPPIGPRGSETPMPTTKTGAAALIEDEPILSKIKRKPYIHIPHKSVPVLGTTIPHLKKRLKAYDWREVRLDRTGYYVVFDDSKRGEDETERCYNECNNQALFTYKMGMECQKYGNPNYERSPSPERVVQEKRKREEIERLQQEEAADLEIEKKNRAENLDPVQGALEQLRAELLDKVMGDVKTRVAIPIFHDSLEPAKHVAKRRKLGLPDPSEMENKAPALLFNKAGEALPDTHKFRRGHPLHSKPLRPHDPNSQRGRKGEKGPTNAFVDERRRKPAPRPSHARGLHFRLQQMYAEEEEDSDDERHTSITRDTEDQESRPLSRASRNSTPFESESVTDTPKHKRRKIADWDEDDDEVFDAFHKEMLGHLLHKAPEDLATRELELICQTLPRTSKFENRARTELMLRQRSKADDDLFQIESVAKKGHVPEDFIVSSKEESTTADNEAKAAKEKAKKKRKTKKELLAEQEALKAEAKKAKATSKPVAEETVKQIEQKELELEAVEEESDRDVDLHLTYDKPRRTVEEDRAVVLDIDGWQQFVKDDEDLAFAKRALAELPSSDVGNAKLWAWKQKEIKALNSDGTVGLAQPEPLISGYYVPNATGCARTEGVKKILNEEKSKYLPHRIKVQRAREERQAQAKANPTAAAEAAKIAAADKIASTATSRSNRVNNRRLVNDINLQKQTLATTNSDADVAIRFNQLKKRKKLVKFDRSAIHGWGLYAEENIAVNDLIIEYVGEKVRQKVADMREIKYEKQGVGSSYLFRMMDDEIVDATKKGGIARFINHSCNPNCTAKIIKVEGTPRIVIYAMKDIMKNEELTYDYKFEREIGSTDRIPCLCGSANCKGFLN
ncbi:Histone-lysine N-methyltransferase, H3 lysine-4 specific [Lecanosticta acicola]|uniref:Histone-lysine N-methyltransferase, H3 lysine-4 specific n=1 Tax=Lecanosticta acicola TaxID=111012 RepID=A0AAI9E7Z3_9PEZI|nr:Histone-lysine N-methyltransferase, H3 lysine-4 specific [Lecanosticta acicola]